MKYYKLKENNACIYGGKKLYTNEKDAHKEHLGGTFTRIQNFSRNKCRSIEELHNIICKYGFSKHVDEIIEKVGVETFEIEFPDIPCIVVKCVELEDQYECDADRTPMFYLNSAKELEDKSYNFDYEVWVINKNGSIELNEELGTYENN